MHDIWNPWHGCIKASEGCKHCYMYYLDRKRGQDGSRIYKTKNRFRYPLQKDRNGNYKIQSGEHIRVCMTSDFFLEEADPWRPEAWAMMRRRSDVIFTLLTKRPQRVAQCLPTDWGDGWDNIFSTSPAKINAAPTSAFRFSTPSPLSTRASCVRPSSGQYALTAIWRKARLSRSSAAVKTTTAPVPATLNGYRPYVRTACATTPAFASSKLAASLSRTDAPTTCQTSASKAKWPTNLA